MNTRKGISPILATVIIIAVTLVIAIGVIGWIMGIWGGFGSTESLQIYPDSHINTTANNLVLHIKNTGTASATFQKIEILGGDVIDTSSSNAIAYQPLGGTNSTVNGLSKVTIGAGEEGYLYIALSRTYTSGATYQVKIYTGAGNVYSAVVRAD